MPAFLQKPLLPTDGKTSPPVRFFTLRAAVLEVKDGFGELKAETQALEWLHFVGYGIIMDRLFKLHNWQFSGGFES